MSGRSLMSVVVVVAEAPEQAGVEVASTLPESARGVRTLYVLTAGRR